MKFIIKATLIIIIAVICFHCSTRKRYTTQPNEVYKTDELVILQLSEHAYQHISFKQTNDFGYVPCNGLVVTNKQEAIIFDTPTNDKSATMLIQWIRQTLKCKINAVIPTHFHDDCLGGLNAFHEHKIPSFANNKTIELAQQNNYPVPQNGFQDALTLKVGDTHVSARFFGEGHTIDNVVGYYPSEQIMFGGCLIKTLGASKGYLGDANVADWSGTVEKVKKEYPDVRIVIPGHGDCGDGQLLEYTIQLFR
jgi:metallo-beta-lactamase class B